MQSVDLSGSTVDLGFTGIIMLPRRFFIFPTGFCDIVNDFIVIIL